MGDQAFRLFISNLPDFITEKDIEEKLAEFGEVSSVEVKERKNVIGKQTPFFAYINIKTKNENIQKCFKDFSTQKFKGIFIDISIARESFMEKLKREREEQAKSSTCSNIKPEDTQKYSRKKDIYPEKHDVKSAINLSNERDVYKTKINGVIINRNLENLNEIKEKPVKIEVKKPLSISEKKRKQSLLIKKKDYQKQKSLIQKALSNIDMKPKGKVIFSNSDDDEPIVSNFFAKNDAQKSENTSTKTLKLFDDDVGLDDGNEVDNINFEVKEHFEGKKGQKLLELQSKFKNDKRFALDARFLEDESSDTESSKSENENNETEQQHKKESGENEKEEQLRILEQVLGGKIARSKLKSEDTKSSKKKLTGMLRYDPEQEEHLKYEIKIPTQELETKKRKRKDSDSKNDEKILQNKEEKPQVSTEKFYKVTDKLKNAFQGGHQFSLLETFGKYNKQESVEVNESVTIIPEKKKKSPLTNDFNPFRYDSSSSDSEEDINKTETVQNTDTNKEEKNSNNLRPYRLHTESFFFKNDDYRLQEGLDFIKRLGAEEQTDFVKLRRSIKEVAKTKVRNNQKKNSQFKRKLGGKKRIKIKRALKR